MGQVESAEVLEAVEGPRGAEQVVVLQVDGPERLQALKGSAGEVLQAVVAQVHNLKAAEVDKGVVGHLTDVIPSQI